MLDTFTWSAVLVLCSVPIRPLLALFILLFTTYDAKKRRTSIAKHWEDKLKKLKKLLIASTAITAMVLGGAVAGLVVT